MAVVAMLLLLGVGPSLTLYHGAMMLRGLSVTVNVAEPCFHGIEGKCCVAVGVVLVIFHLEVEPSNQRPVFLIVGLFHQQEELIQVRDSGVLGDTMLGALEYHATKACEEGGRCLTRPETHSAQVTENARLVSLGCRGKLLLE
jgi:hypothetical protein